jgi:outer membrane autotransporter protein
MSISLKKILFAGTALVAMNYATHAYAVCLSTNGGPGTVTIGTGNCVDIDTDPAAATAISFTSGEGDATAYVYDGVDITGNIITDTDGLGYMNLMGDTTVSGTVGAAGLALSQIWAGAEGATDTFSGDVFAEDIDIGSGIVNFDGNVDITSATTFQFQGNGTANFNGNMVTGDIDFNGYNGIANFADGANITGDIFDGGEAPPGSGTVNFAGSSTVDGNIGLDGEEISEIFFNGGAGKTVDISGGIHTLEFTAIVNGVGTVNIGGEFNEGNLQFNEDGTVNWAYEAGEGYWNGDIYSNGGTVGNGIGTLNILGEYPYLDGSFGGGEGVLTEFFFGGGNTTMTVNGYFYAADTNTLNGNVIDIAADSGDFFIAEGQTLNTSITGASDDEIGHINAGTDNTATVESGTIVDIVVDPSNTDYIGVGETYTIVDSTFGNGSIGTADVQDTLLLDFEQYDPNADDDLAVEIVGRKRISEVFGGNIGDAIDDACDPEITEGGCSGEIKELENALLSEDDQGAGEDRLEAAGGDQNGGGTQGALDIVGATGKMIDDHILEARANEMGSGMSAGAAANGSKMWLQGYGQRAQQDFRDGIAGYDSYTAGGAIGADSADIMEGGILGLAFNYAVTNISSNNLNTTSTQVKNTGGTLYGTHEFGDGVFMRGQAGYSSNKIESTRHNVGGFAGLIAHADYNSDQYAAKAILGRDYAAASGLTLTPSAMASYTYLKTDGYTETGNAGLLLLKVKDDSFDFFKLGVDLNAEWSFKNADGGEMKPALRVGYAYDVTGDNLDSTASFVGGGSTFTTTGADPARNIFKAGAGLTYVATSNWDLKADYDYTYKQDYDSHAGTIRATTHF